MKRITRLKGGKGREKRVNLYLDGRFSFSISAEVALNKELKVGQELTESEIAELQDTDQCQRCYNAAIRFLGYRQRSEAEVRQRLRSYGFDNECEEKTIGRLKEQGLVDDAEFARFWIENRETFSPRSRWLTGMELERKGLDRVTIDATICEIDDLDSAYRAARTKAGRLSISDYRLFRNRLGEYLRRKGFSYEVINETIEKLRKEHNSPVHG
jgi:regulatory protein